MMSENRVGIYTISKQFLLMNYGSFFQHWSLRLVLKEMGYDPFRLLGTGEGRDDYSYWRHGVKRLLQAVWCTFRWRRPFDEEWRKARYEFAINVGFRRDYRRLIGAVNELQGESTVTVFGSDQIWTTLNDRIKEVSDKKKKVISYAASADWVEGPLKPGWHDFMRELLTRFDAVSIRESAGVDVVKPLLSSGREVVKMRDPVFLQKREDYLALAPKRRIFRRPTLLAYIVNMYERSDMYLEKLEAIAKLRGCELKVIGLQGMELYTPLKYQMLVRPCEFIRCFWDANYIVTNSFHGIAFCLLLQKQFVCLTQRDYPGTNQNTRQIEVLSDAGLSDRLLERSEAPELINNKLAEKIDYGEVSSRIADWRENGLKFLNKVLSKDIGR